MSEKDEIREELQRLSPLLSKMKEDGKQPFRAPEGYFQGLPEEVLRRAKAEEGLVRESRPVAQNRKVGAWLQWLLFPRRAVGLAMALLLVAAGTYLFWPRSASYNPEEALAGISVEEAQAYVSENIGDFELEVLLDAAVVSAEDVPQIELLPDVGQEDIDRYLDEVLDDISLDELEELL